MYENSKTYKIVVVGDSTVGKTTFIHYYVSDVFIPDYRSTVGGKHRFVGQVMA